MPVEVILPKVDMDMTHGTIAVWHVAEGDTVQKGAALFDIETDKAAMEVEAPATGTLRQISAKAGDKIEVGTVVAWLYSADEILGPAIEPANSVQVDNTGAAPPVLIQPVEVIMPKVDMDMTHGTLAAWHVSEGASVKQGTTLFDIETDKAAMEVEAPATGTLHHINAKPGDKIAVGSVVAWIYPAGAIVGAITLFEAEIEPAAVEQIAGPVLRATLPNTVEMTAIRATPAARKAARIAGLALETVRGSGPLGRRQRDDITPVTRPLPVVEAPQTWVPERGPLYISRRPGDGIPIMLIHGFAADSQSWAPFEKALGQEHPLIRVDLPGHGKSPKQGISSFPELVSIVSKAFDQATHDVGPVHLLGHSLGGALAIALADIRGRKIASLSAIAPAGLGPEIDADALGGIVRATRVESLAPWLRRLTATPEGISDDYARAAMSSRSDPALRAVQSEMTAALFPDGVQSFDLRAALSRLKCATQILWGRQDHILPSRHALATNGDFAIHLLNAAGHVPQIECPERVARIFKHFVAGYRVLV